MLTKEKAFGPHPFKSYTYRELPIGATSIGIHDDMMKTGSWRTDVKPVFKEKTSPCNQACPAGVDVRGFVSLVKQGLFAEASALYMEENPFPALCARICYHPCEIACNRKDFDQSVSINALERFIADYDAPVPKSYSASGKRVGIVGSGPAGMACSFFLTRLGHHVTVFESLEVIGGLLRTGIPDYRLPVRIVEKEVEKIKSLGVEFKTNNRINGETWKDLEIFDAILLAYGASEQLPPPFISTAGSRKKILSGLKFLKDVKLGSEVSLGKRVIVIGGGNTAIDAARVSLRLGALPIVLYRRGKSEMPAFPSEIEDAVEEGVQFHFLTSPVGLQEGESCLRVNCVKNQLAEVDASGRSKPIPIEGSDYIIEADTIISAIGETPDLSFLPREIQVSNKSVVVNESGSTDLSGVFACGDLVSQPRSVVHAIGSGKKVALAIDSYLRKTLADRIGSSQKPRDKWSASFRSHVEGTRQDFEKVVLLGDLNTAYFFHEERCERPKATRKFPMNNKEIYGTLEVQQALREAERCFSCGMCNRCDNCFIFCPDSSVVNQGDAGMNVIDYTYCKGCGICANECPAGVITMEKEV